MSGAASAAAPIGALEFGVSRMGEIMRTEAGEPHEAWGVLNPGGVRAPDGTMHLFPRLVAEGNYSRIGHARVIFENDKPVGVERLGVALEPHEPYEVNAGGGGVEDPRVVYVPALERYVMTYTAFIPYEPKIAVAVSKDLVNWERLGVLRYLGHESVRISLIGNKDSAFFPTTVRDAEGVESLAILHRPTTRIRLHLGADELILPPHGDEKRESIWISYVPLQSALDDIANLTLVRGHERVMGPQESWESVKLGAGSPPIRYPGGWLLPYHAVSASTGHLRYCMGAAILDLDRPSRVLYRTPEPILQPETDYERNGAVADVVFPTATDQRPDGLLDVYYGAADHVIAAARVTLPKQLTLPGALSAIK
jgi:predicted GH43/DUF377 family glycosyl hydrolase